MTDDISQFLPTRRGGWQVTADFNEVTGEIEGFDVGHGHSPTSPFASESLEVEPQIEKDALEPVESEGDQMVIDALIELYPNIDAILDYAVDTYGEDYMSDYDQAVDQGDWNKVQEVLERLSAELPEESPSFESETPSQEDVDTEISSLLEAEPEGMELAYQLLQMAESSQNPIEQAILMTSSSFHAGQITAEEGVQQLSSRYSMDQLAPIYQKLLNE